MGMRFLDSFLARNDKVIYKMKNFSNLIKSRKFWKTSTLIFIILLAAGIYIYYQLTDGRVFISNSIIQAPVITVSPSIYGRVTEIDAKEGQKVQSGDTLAVVGSETIRAATDGLITSATDLTGSNVNPQTQLIQMIRPVNMRVAGTIDENKGLNNLRIGQSVSFTIDALPGKTFWGYIDEISPSALTQVFSFSTSTERPTQQFEVYAKFDSSQYPEIKNGMSASMVVYTKTK